MMKPLLPTEESRLPKILFAVLPVAGMVTGIREAVAVGAVTAVGLLFTVFLLKTLLPWIPQETRRLVAAFTFAFFAQLGWYIMEIHPLWMTSAYFLLPEFLFAKKSVQQKVFPLVAVRAAGFFFVTFYLGLCYEILAKRLLVFSFFTPFGTLFLLTVVAFLWKNQPKETSAVETAS